MNLVSWTLEFDFRAPYWQREAVFPGFRFPVHGLGLGYPSLRYAAVIGASSPVHAPASALLSDWTMRRTVHQQNILVVMTTHGQLNFSIIYPSWKFYFCVIIASPLNTLSFWGEGYLNLQIFKTVGHIQLILLQSVDTNAWTLKKICRMLGISSPRIRVLLINNGYKWLIVSMLCFLFKYIHGQAAIKSVSFFMIFKWKIGGKYASGLLYIQLSFQK